MPFKQLPAMHNYKTTASNERLLITKKLVNGKTLALILSLCLLYLMLHVAWIMHLPWYLIILIEVPMLLIVWNRAYQVVYDLKLLFFFNDDFDVIHDQKTEKLPGVAFVLPSYHEPFMVAKMTFDSVVNAP